MFSSSRAPAVLWLAPESFTGWDALAGALERCPGLRLTVGVTPALAQAARPALGAALASGRVELAARLAGDPILPAAYERSLGLQPERTVDRVAGARALLRADGAAPAGFVPGDGALSAPLIAALEAAGAGWAAAGPYAGADLGWAQAGPLVLVPFRPADPGAALDAQAPGKPVVVDETAVAAPDTPFEGRLRALAAGSQSCPDWTTVAQAVAGRPEGRRDASSVDDWPTWSGRLALSDDSAGRAWPLYAAAADALTRYQNSGSADLRALEAASDSLSAAEASRFYRVVSSTAGAPVAPQLRADLLGVYHEIRRPVPQALLDGEPASQAAGDDGAVRVVQGSGWLEFDNPEGSLSRAPDAASPLDDGSPAASIWKLEALRVEPSDVATSFVFRMAHLDSTARDAAGLGRLLLETYIDINHRPGAGATKTLDPEAGLLVARDGWEYALSVSASGAFLVRSNPLGSPVVVGRPDVVVDAQRREIRVNVSHALLQGTPSRWGYVAAAYALDPSVLLLPQASKAPPKPLWVGGGPILGLLGSVDEQKRVVLRAGPRPLLTPLRAETGAGR